MQQRDYLGPADLTLLKYYSVLLAGPNLLFTDVGIEVILPPFTALLGRLEASAVGGEENVLGHLVPFAFLILLEEPTNVARGTRSSRGAASPPPRSTHSVSGI